MFSILGFLFFLVIALLLVGLTLVGSLVKWLFGGGGHVDTNDGSTRSGTRIRTADTSAKRNKVFGDDEGEYVDYEEVDEGADSR